jgi:hypothetical protein
MTNAQTVKRMNEIRDLLSEFGANLSGFNPGVSAYLPNKRTNILGFGRGFFGEHISLSNLEWEWLEPLLVELRDLRNECGTGKRITDARKS